MRHSIGLVWGWLGRHYLLAPGPQYTDSIILIYLLSLYIYICIIPTIVWGTGFLQIGKEWGEKVFSNWHLPLICHSFYWRRTFNVVRYPYNANSELYYSNHKLVQRQGRLEPRQVLRKKATNLVLKYFCGCTGKWELVKPAPSQKTTITDRIRMSRSPEWLSRSNILVLSDIILLAYAVHSFSRRFSHARWTEETIRAILSLVISTTRRWTLPLFKELILSSDWKCNLKFINLKIFHT